MYLSKFHAFLMLMLSGAFALFQKIFDKYLDAWLEGHLPEINQIIDNPSLFDALAIFFAIAGLCGLIWPVIKRRFFKPDNWIEYTPDLSACYYQPQKGKGVTDFIVLHQYDDGTNEYLGHYLSFWLPHAGKISHAFASYVGLSGKVSQEEISLEKGGGLLWISGDNWDRRIRVEVHTD